ncbi:MAG TPA: M55 family metallopeptidase [Planctomycetota bacterium]|nr:M55 family metallopeptidase [Planctomycetota bacterium]
MKIYLYTDLEGVAGVDQWDNRASDRPGFVGRRREMCELLMGEVNAAADGAFAGGATGVVLVQGHGDSAVYELADERLEIVKGSGYSTWLPELGAEFAAAFYVGSHAMGGTAGATLAHTFCFEDGRRWWLGDREIGEFGAFAAIAGAHGVPVVLATGDDKLCAEARAFVPEIETAQVKVGIGTNSARHLSMRRAREVVRMAALRATERAARGEVPLYRPPGPPYVARFRSRRRHLCLPRTQQPGERWLSPYEVEFSGDDLLEVLGRLTFFY